MAGPGRSGFPIGKVPHHRPRKSRIVDFPSYKLPFSLWIFIYMFPLNLVMISFISHSNFTMIPSQSHPIIPQWSQFPLHICHSPAITRKPFCSSTVLLSGCPGAVQKAGEQWQNPTLVPPKSMGFSGIMMGIVWWLTGDMMGYWDCGNMGLWWDYKDCCEISIRYECNYNEISWGHIYQNPYIIIYTHKYQPYIKIRIF